MSTRCPRCGSASTEAIPERVLDGGDETVRANRECRKCHESFRHVPPPPPPPEREVWPWTWMLRNSRGKPDALLTFSAGAVAVVLVKVLVHGTTIKGIDLGDIDAGIIAAVLGPTLGAYTWKRTAVDKGQGVEVPPSPPRGFTLWGIAVLVAIGFGIYVYATGVR